MGDAREGNRKKTGILLALVTVLAGCAGAGTQVCPTGLKPMIAAELYFGLSIPGGGTVSEADWRRFVDEEITPRFPDGLTITAAEGQWKDRTGMVREPSKRLFVAIAGAQADDAKLEAIRAAFRTRFRQQAVLRVETPVCAGF
jgi:hypothetical protein